MDKPLPANRQHQLLQCLSHEGLGILLEMLTAERDALAVQIGQSAARGESSTDGRVVQLPIDAPSAKAHRRARNITIVLVEMTRLQALDRHTIATLTQVTHESGRETTESGA